MAMQQLVKTRLQLECSYSSVSGDAFSAWEPINVLGTEGGKMSFSSVSLVKLNQLEAMRLRQLW
jgi:hypothetical protein